jgi:Ca2+-binding RTX toxin-like protein
MIKQLALASVLLGTVGSLAACDLGEVDPFELATNDLAKGQDPCQDPQIRQRATVQHVPGDPHRFIGTDGDDVIIGTDGDDVIFGNGGDDLICGLDGDDYIDGGAGKDRIFAGPGDDIVHGRADSDLIYGGPGDDILFGDILDDEIHGDDGNDILIGGHGTDILDGGSGDDFLRGDTGNDTFIGGPGYDIVSFATALPPGQPEVKADGSPNEITGVKIDFNANCGGGGCADGDGGNEPLEGIEGVVGSSFTDDITAGTRQVQTGYGLDRVNGAPVAGATLTPVSTVYVDATKDRAGRLVDVGIVVMGSPVRDVFAIHGNGDIVNIESENPVTAIAPCTQTDATHVRCDIGTFVQSQPHRPSPFHFLVGWGDAGDDEFTFDGTFPREFEAHVSGGPGNDHLVGGDEADVFFTGVDGEDHLEGNGGDDALIGESHHDASWDKGDRPDVANYHDGADILDGGSGDDQLVVDYVCGGHRYIGGPGRDIAGFARSGFHAINAQLGGPSKLQTKWYGAAANMDLCGSKPGAWTTWKTGVDADLEVLEASDGPDHLWGDDRANTIWGRGGGDHIYGLGGDDVLLGADGNDVIDGGAGNNQVSYGTGQDDTGDGN